jgi:hypothetical protein
MNTKTTTLGLPFTAVLVVGSILLFGLARTTRQP